MRKCDIRSKSGRNPTTDLKRLGGLFARTSAKRMQLHVGAPAALEGKRRQLFSNSQPAWRFALVKAWSAAKGSTPKDQMERYSRWWQEGYLSSTGRCFDIGLTVSAALKCSWQRAFPPCVVVYRRSAILTSGVGSGAGESGATCQPARRGHPKSTIGQELASLTTDANAASSDPHTAGNGSLMRLAPVPLAYRGKPCAGHSLRGRKLANHARRARRGRCVQNSIRR